MAAVTDTGTIQFSRTAADTRTVFNSRTVTNSGAITRAVTNAAAVGTGLAAAAGYIGTGIGYNRRAAGIGIAFIAGIAITGTARTVSVGTAGYIFTRVSRFGSRIAGIALAAGTITAATVGTTQAGDALTGIGLDFVARHRTITVAIIAVTGTIIIAAGIGEVVAFAVSAATRTVRGTNASFAVLPSSAAVIITGTRVAVLAGRIFCGCPGVTD